jgi:hypothetical protein
MHYFDVTTREHGMSERLVNPFEQVASSHLTGVVHAFYFTRIGGKEEKIMVISLKMMERERNNDARTQSGGQDFAVDFVVVLGKRQLAGFDWST